MNLYLTETSGTVTGNVETSTDVVASAISAIVNWALTTGIKVVIALVVLFISFRIINAIGRKIEKRGENGRFDKTIMRTIAYLVKIAGKVVIVVCLVGYLGIDTSGITALIASFGVCFGLAVNGALSNIAGGVLILVTRPFKVDDYIEAQGVSGTVEDIHMVCTKIRTGDNKVVYVPNGTLANGNIINYSEKDTRRVDMVFSVDYSSDTALAEKLITELLEKHELVLKDPAFFVRVTAHSDSSIDITARAWVKSSDYWTVYYDMLGNVKSAFDANNIEIPYNILDVHIKKD